MYLGDNGPAGPKVRTGRVASSNLCQRKLFKRATGLALAGALLVLGGQGGAGHQVGHYPSYYPDEIRIDVVDPAAAGNGLRERTLHAYVGAEPSFAGPLPEHVKSVRSLGSFLVLSFDAASQRLASVDARCAIARRIVAGLREETAGGFVFHPYPVTPYHADYLHHVDRVQTVVGGLAGAAAVVAKVHVKGTLAEAIVARGRSDATDAGDIVVEAVPVEDLLSAAGVQLDGWSGPPWIREGWFHAYRLLAPGLEGAEREAVEQAYEALIRGQARSIAEHVDLERRLLAALVGPCRRLVVGYVPRLEYFNDKYPEGAENIGNDALSGLNAPLFIRTVKLKDYPWNGKLQLGVRHPAGAAWNPVAGFTDGTGQLIWAAVADPAMIPFPDNASWMPNRVQSEVARVVGQSGGVRVPEDALCPQVGSGALQRVGERAFASVKVVYEILASPFEDGTELAVADLLYPYAFLYRWGANTDRGAAAREPALAPALASLQERLVGLKHVRTDKSTHAIAEGLSLEVQTPVLEVYLRDTPGDERQVAALAPPWSTVPWHLLALMEEAVGRGYAAFSQGESARRQVPWLDLVRDRTLAAKLQDLIATFEREGYRPEALKDLVTTAEAQKRWKALGEFAKERGHLLVTNGPYRLKQWTAGSVVLEAVRDITYPLGFGTFDRFVNPPRATIDSVTQDGGEIAVRASAEMILKAGRGYRLTKEPLLRTTTRGVNSMLVVSRYLIIAPDERVLKVDKMHWAEDGRFDIKLPQDLPPGEYAALLGIFLDGNALQPSTKVVRFRLDAAAR